MTSAEMLKDQRELNRRLSDENQSLREQLARLGEKLRELAWGISEFIVDGHEFVLRPARLSDEHERSLIIATWLRTYANGSAFARVVDRRQVFDFHDVIVKRLLASCSVRVVQPIEVETSVLAWVCDDGDTLHYVCCKKDQYKRLGLASRLMEGRNYRQHTHRTDEWARTGIEAGEYMPYVALLGKEAA